MKAQLQKLFAQFKIVPTAFKSIYRDSVSSIKAQYRAEYKGEKLTRREVELIRTNLGEMSRAILLGVFAAPPIIGYLPLILAFSYPRQLLSKPFWSEEQRNSFFNDEFQERKEATQELQKFIKHPSDQAQNSTSFLSSIGSAPISTLSSAHINTLARANAIFNIPFLYHVIPKPGVTFLLSRRAKEIHADDLLLETEGIADLSYTELQIACLRRGFHPGKPIEELRQTLSSWTSIKNMHIQSKTTTASNRPLTSSSSSSSSPHNSPANSPSGSAGNDDIKETALLHLTAGLR